MTVLSFEQIGDIDIGDEPLDGPSYSGLLKFLRKRGATELQLRGLIDTLRETKQAPFGGHDVSVAPPLPPREESQRRGLNRAESAGMGAAVGEGFATRAFNRALPRAAGAFLPPPMRGAAAILGALGGVASHDLASGKRTSLDSITGPAAMETFAQTLPSAVLGVGSSIFRFAGWATGLMSPPVKKLISELQQAGLKAAAIDTNLPFFRAAARVGGVIPIISTPIKRHAAKTAQNVSNIIRRKLGSISPIINVNRLGYRISTDVNKMLSARHDMAQGTYDAMENAIHAADVGVPVATRRVVPLGQASKADRTESVLQIARRELAKLDELPQRVSGKRKGQRAGFQEVQDAFRDALRSFTEVGNKVSITEGLAMVRNLNLKARELSGSANAMSPNEFRIVEELAHAMRSAVKNVKQADLIEAYGEKKGKILQQHIFTGSRAWEEYKGLLDTAAAKAFKQVDPNFFKTGFVEQGSKEVDETAFLFINGGSSIRSREFIQGFERLAGKANRKALGRLIILKALNPRPEGVRLSRKSEDVVMMFDADRARQRLGLTASDLVGDFNPKQTRAALDELLKGTEVSVKELEQFLDAAARLQRLRIHDPSTYLTRRVILSGSLKPPGFSTGQAAAAGAAGAAGGVGAFLAPIEASISVGAFLMSGFYFNKLIATPQGLRLLTEGMKPNLTRQAYQRLATRMVALAGEE